jgi:hypothetical protein
VVRAVDDVWLLRLFNRQCRIRYAPGRRLPRHLSYSSIATWNARVVTLLSSGGNALSKNRRGLPCSKLIVRQMQRSQCDRLARPLDEVGFG